jgi:hypothetical protein
VPRHVGDEERKAHDRKRDSNRTAGGVGYQSERQGEEEKPRGDQDETPEDPRARLGVPVHRLTGPTLVPWDNRLND